jgi:hypothetical protein
VVSLLRNPIRLTHPGTISEDTDIEESSLGVRMVKIYYHDNADTDQRLPHEGELVPTSALKELGVYATNIPEQAQVDAIALEKGYKNRDQVSPFPHPSFLEKLQSS